MNQVMAYRLWLYANRTADNAHAFDPGRGQSAGPLLTLEMTGEGMRAAMLGLLVAAGEDLGDFAEVPASLFTIVRALDTSGVRPFSADEIEAVLMVDRIRLAGLERHLIAEEACRIATRHACFLHQRLANELRAVVTIPNGGA